MAADSGKPKPKGNHRVAPAARASGKDRPSDNPGLVLHAEPESPKPSSLGARFEKSFKRIDAPITLVLALLTLVLGFVTYRTQFSGPGYVETNGNVVTRLVDSKPPSQLTAQVQRSGIGAVRQAVYVATPDQIKRRLKKLPAASSTATDAQRIDDADALFRRSDFRAAASAYENLHQRFPAVAEIRVNLSVNLQLVGEYDEAARVLQEIAPRSSDELRANEKATAIAILANLAQALVLAKQPERASATLQLASAVDQSDPVVLNSKGVQAYANGDFAAASSAFRAARSRGKGLPAHEYDLATALLDEGVSNPAAKEEAEDLIEKLGKEASNSGDVLSLLGRFSLESGDSQKAREYFERAIQAQPNRADLYYNAAVASVNSDPAAAKRYFRQANVELPSMPPAPPVARPAVAQGQSNDVRSASTTNDATNRETRIEPTTPRKRAASSGVAVRFRVRTRPGTDAPAATTLTVDGVDVFGSLEQARSFRDCSLIYGSVQVGADGSISSASNLEMKTGNPAFERSIRSWLERNGVMHSQSGYECRIEADVVFATP